MPKRPSKPRAEDDVNLTAFRVVQQTIANDDAPAAPPIAKADDQPREKNAAAVALGRLGGKKGGKNRMALLTPEERTSMAKAAAARRWAHKNGAERLGD